MLTNLLHCGPFKTTMWAACSLWSGGPWIMLKPMQMFYTVGLQVSHKSLNKYRN